jgi:hypothetical protein
MRRDAGDGLGINGVLQDATGGDSGTYTASGRDKASPKAELPKDPCT